jgi:serine/threonine protein kinase
MDIKYLAEGTYGCVFNSEIQCRTEPKVLQTKKKYVSKVTLVDYKDTERKIGKSIIKEIKQYESYFAPIIDTCEINIGVIKESELKKCNVVKKANKRNEHPIFVSNKMKFAGNGTIMDYLDSKGYLSKEIFETHLHLTKGLEKLQMISDPIIHYDLKDGNIMFDDIYKVPILIDFGLSFRESNLRIGNRSELMNIFYTDESYSPWSIEIHLLSFITQKILKKGIDIENELLEKYLNKLFLVVDKFIKSEKKIFEYDEEKIYFRVKLYEYLTAFKSESVNIIMIDLMRNWNTWDNYSIAVMFNSCLIYNESKIDMSDKYVIRYRNLLKQILLATPHKVRLNPKETSKMIISLCK